MAETGRWFASRRDTWIGLVIWMATLGSLAAMVAGEMWGAAMAVTALAALLAWAWFGTGYRLTEEHLVATSGPLRWRIPLADITSVSPTRMPMSSPALSLDRLIVKHGRAGFLLISPLDKRGFLEALRLRCPPAAIRVDGSPRPPLA